MKIIGHKPYGYLVEFDTSEMQALCGQGGDRYTQLGVGTVVEISSAWRKVSSIVNNASDLRKSAGTLRGLADVLDGSAALVDRATELVPTPPHTA